MDKKDKLNKIIKLAETRGITAYQIAKNTNLSEAGIGKILNGKSKNPHISSIDTIINFLDNYPTNLTNQPFKNINENKFAQLPDGEFILEVQLIPFNAYASYLESLETGEVSEFFETIIFPVDKYGSGNYKAFKIKGDSMNGGHIDDTPDGATVLAKELCRHQWKDGFQPSNHGWIILSKVNIFHKDIINLNNETGDITLHSRNKSPEYSNFTINLNNVYQIFKVIKRIF